MIEKTKSPKGYLKINDIEYTFSLEGKYLFLFHKYTNSGNSDLTNWGSIKKEFPADGAWIVAHGEIRSEKYYFHCSNPFFHTNHKFSLIVDYYAKIVSDEEIEDFGNSFADEFLFTSDFIGEYIKDCIVVQHSANEEPLKLEFPQKSVKLEDKNFVFTFCHAIIGNPAYYGLSAIKPILKVVTPGITINSMIEIFGNIIRTFSFIFRKNAVTVPEITILQKVHNEKSGCVFQVYFTDCASNEIQYNRVVSARALPYFDKIYQLVSSGELNTYHIPRNRSFEVTHLVLMYSWFEKLYKTLPCNSFVELKINKNGKKQLYWKAGYSDSKKSGNLISDKDQLSLMLKDNPKLKDYALELLMRIGGWFQIDEFFDKFPVRVSDYRNNIIHNDDILWYPFIFQDTQFLELINYYLVMKYKCQCTDRDLDQLIHGWFLDL